MTSHTDAGWDSPPIGQAGEDCPRSGQAVPAELQREGRAYCPLHSNGRIVAVNKEGGYRRHPVARIPYEWTVEGRWGETGAIGFAEAFLRET